MIIQKHIADFTTSYTGGHFAAIRLDDFSEEHVAATAVYSRKDFYKISLITGDATYHYHDRAFRMNPSKAALIFTNCDTPYRWEVHSGTCSGYACMFTPDFFPIHMHQKPSDWPVFDANGQYFFLLDQQEEVFFTDFFQKMLREQASTYSHKYELLFLYVLECIHLALKLNPTVALRTQTAATRLTDAFKALLAEQFPLVTPLQPISLRNPQAFANQLAVHTNYLNRAVKQVTGKTTSQLLTERIIQEARALLLHSDWSISEISYSLGFDEPAHFARTFRKHTGQRPSALRQPGSSV